jgi:hypothetical protein
MKKLFATTLRTISRRRTEKDKDCGGRVKAADNAPIPDLHIIRYNSQDTKYNQNKIGNVTLKNENGYISVNHSIGRVVNNVEELISAVYPDIFNLSNKSYQWLCERAIIPPRNVTAEEINDIILLKFDGYSGEYLLIQLHQQMLFIIHKNFSILFLLRDFLLIS